jgi:LPS-assembly protein
VRVALIALALGAAGELAAQSQTQGQNKQGPARPGAKPGAARPKTEQQQQPQDVHIRADKQEVIEKGHARATGFVDVRAGDLRIQSDVMDVYETPRPDGGKGHRVVAVGNVVFLREEERIAGEHLEMDLESGQGTFTNAMGYVQPGIFVEARRIERIDADHYRVEGAKFTSCAQPNPRWGFTSTSARIHVDDKIVANNVLFKVKSVPVLALPWLVYPIRDDQRATGLLLPQFGYSSQKGFYIAGGFFWAMGRSFDQTFYADHYSNFGSGFGHEFRYILDPQSRGTFKSYRFRPKDSNSWDYDLDYSALQALPAGFRGTLRVRRYSSTLFQQQIQDSLNQAVSRTQNATLSVQRSLGPFSVQAMADSVETFFSQPQEDGTLFEQTSVNRHLPMLKLSSIARKIGHTPFIFGFEVRGEELGLGQREGESSNQVGEIFRYSRFDALPSLSVSTGTTYLQLTPRVQFRYTRYGKSVSNPDDVEAGVANPIVDGPALERRYVEGSVELRGPQFSRVFTNTPSWYTDKIKHVIGPIATYTYRTNVEDFGLIPRFDGNDLVPGTNSIQYGLEQSLIAKRPGSSGKLAPYTFLTWRLLQTRYFDLTTNRNQNLFDSDYSSTPFALLTQQAQKYSPLRSELFLRPAPAFSTNFTLEYDTVLRQLRRISLNSGVNTTYVGLSAIWSQGLRANADPTKRVLLSDTIRLTGRLSLIPDHLTLDGSYDYDRLAKTRVPPQPGMLHATARLNYSVQCCGFTVETIQYRLSTRLERAYRFSIELANIGSIGNFNSGDQTQGRTGVSRGF